MNTARSALFSVSLIVCTVYAEEFTPKITITNKTSSELSLYTAGKPSMWYLPKGHSHSFAHTFHTQMLYLSKDATLSHDQIREKGWCIVDVKEKTLMHNKPCWNDERDSTDLQTPCKAPLITQQMLDQSIREQKDISVTIADGINRPFVGSVNFVPRRGYLGGIWHGTKSFVGSFFGRP